VAELPISLPDRSTRNAISAILGALDDKIDLNRRMNATLEELARTLFRSWFVDFDPVKAKAEGRQPEGMDAATAALFPSRFVDSELGRIPEGWGVSDVYAIAAVDYGAPYASSRFSATPNGFPLIRIRDLKSQSADVWTDETHPREVRVTPGDCIVGMDGEFRATLWVGQESVLNQRLCRFRPLRPSDATFVRLAIEPALAYVERTEVATTVIHLGKSDIDEFRLVVPDATVRDRFGALAAHWTERELVCAAESRTLAALRDLLLPKLISGELRVPDAEKLVEAAL